MPERTGRYAVGVGFKHPVTMCKASLIGLSNSAYVHCDSMWGMVLGGGVDKSMGGDV